MEKRQLEHTIDIPPAKARRTTRACLQCRARKQRCSPEPDGPQAPCRRCRQQAITCSFQNQRVVTFEEEPGPSRMAQLVVELHHQINQHEARIAQLEKQAQNTDAPSKIYLQVPAETPNRPPLTATPSHSPGFSMDGIDLGPPIATLRSLGALAKNDTHSGFDPVARGIISMEDAQSAITLFFDHCHPWAPFLGDDIRHSWQDLRRTTPVLFLAICSVGMRFQNSDPTQNSSLTALLDHAVSRLLLRPTLSDVTLDSIRVLLLYAQWMPYTVDDDHAPKSRYNEISAWAVLGLAVRYALFIGLDQRALQPFAQSSTAAVSADEVARLRVWYNLLTCDFNLMLTSGLPASLDPTISGQLAPRFGVHRLAHQPADLRVSGLVELVAVVHRTMRCYGDVSGRQINVKGLQQLNAAFDEWEKLWVERLARTPSQHNQLPFTSVRWYRLALNSAALAPLLSTSRPPASSLSSLAPMLATSLTAAGQILLSLSSNAADYIWRLDLPDCASLPEGELEVDPAAVQRLRYAVDSTWISHTFAVTFLVLCYIRSVIDGDMQVCTIGQPMLPPSPGSIISRLLRLARDLFDAVCSSSTFHPAREFRTIVQNATALVLASTGHEGPIVDELALQSVLDQMNEAGFEWPGTLMDPGDFWDIDINLYKN
ncbi:hypothetical protein BO94DRAFT_625431 [Aspergillus sclerotioniger CBS 115572]|uniref:Zn(2)-C6 fungal-type domain-containing protein n=1 Tax=Aspergillus sclerotioniger CBS 115572 TaxID=1450535 RepID=A0A317WF73_9EURO|nr:hypothetical protein BO94DRAFT_625431 [Aspergillus sclerotioniger CBS 115572]PWY83882.1 hypothetical protein BO94DRAFT_625431 [Aspergillus sclerotioniger CBS 115572]